METTFNKVYPVEYITKEVKSRQIEPLNKQSKTYEKRARFRRSTLVYNVINYIVKNVYLINDDYNYDNNKKTETDRIFKTLTKNQDKMEKLQQGKEESNM